MPDRDFYEGARKRAHNLYVTCGQSLRDIAEQVLPDTKGGWVTVQRWSVRPDPDSGLTWKQEREQFLLDERARDRARYLQLVTEIKDRNLRIAGKLSVAMEKSIDAYFEVGGDGDLHIKLHPKTGLPLISPMALAPLLNAVNEIQNRTLGLDNLSIEEQTQVAVTESATVESTIAPEALKRLGDALALDALSSPPPSPLSPPPTGELSPSPAPPVPASPSAG